MALQLISTKHLKNITSLQIVQRIKMKRANSLFEANINLIPKTRQSTKKITTDQYLMNVNAIFLRYAYTLKTIKHF